MCYLYIIYVYFTLPILDADLVTKSKLSRLLNTCSRRIEETLSSDNKRRQIFPEEPSTQETKAKVQMSLELRKKKKRNKNTYPLIL